MYKTIDTIDAHVHLTAPLYPQDYPEDMKSVKENPLDSDCVRDTLRMMDRNGVDKCLIMPGQGLSVQPLENKTLIRMAEMLPERIAGVLVGFTTPAGRAWDYDPDEAAAEVERYLQHPLVKGLGEFAISAVGYMADWPAVWEKLRNVFDVLAEHNAIALFHTGGGPSFPKKSKERIRSRRGLYFSNPMLIDDIAEEYPEVPILIGHAGVQGYFYYGSYADMALTVAARHPNVYIETSSVPYETLLKCVEEPAIGPEKLIFGTDTPAFFRWYRSPSTGECYPTYGKDGIGDVVPDHYRFDMANIDRLPITDVERQMIMGGTIAKLMDGKH